MGLTHDIPAEFTSEGRWFRYLSNKGMTAVLIGCAFTAALHRIAAIFHAGMAGIIAGVLFTGALGFFTMFPLPEQDYLRGGGITLDIIILRRIIRRMNRRIYVKGIAEKEDAL